jgi:predicted MFS family arabinose efflux permease
VLGTAFPHLLKFLGQAWPWQAVLAGVSLVAAAGGLLMFAAVPDGPYLTRAARFDPHALQKVFRSRRFRASAFGYFGHMWELYAFWAFVPLIIAAFAPAVDASLWSFGVIAAGAAGCAVGGLVSLKLGSTRVAVAHRGATHTHLACDMDLIDDVARLIGPDENGLPQSRVHLSDVAAHPVCTAAPARS